MRENFINFNYNYIITKSTKKYDERTLKIIKYGLECIYTVLTKSIVVFLLSFFIGIFNETLLLMIFYTFLRMFGFGIHASSNLKCWIASLSIYLILPLIIKYIFFDKFIIILLESICILGYALWAPADTKKRPLIHKEKRIKNKIIVLIIASVYFLYSFYNVNLITKCMLFGMLIQFVVINPFTYKLFKQPYQNYKNFSLV